MRKPVLLALAALAACSRTPVRKAVPGDLLVVEGKVEKGPLGFAAGDLAALPRRTVRGADPAAGRVGSFAGPSLAELVVERLPLRPGVDVVVLHGRGGLRVPVPLNALRQSRPVLATEAEGRPLDGWAGGSGPLLVAWPDAEAPGLDTDPRIRWWWVRGVARLEMASWAEKYGRALRVPLGAGDDARRGADLFASQCLHCHRIRGQGGEVGPELTAAPLAGGRLERTLPGHLAAVGGGAPELPGAAASQVAAFIAAVQAAAGDRPQDEPAPEPERSGARRQR
ncbi:MAG TPA: c-type cytochrome [Anaeromyxobacteraceae bacterium]|jgi:mono/diheme cytochrome c family protein